MHIKLFNPLIVLSFVFINIVFITAQTLWTKQNSFPSDYYLESVVWTGNQFVAVGNMGPMADSSLIVTSPDGINWTPRFVHTLPVLMSIIWTGSELFAVGYGGTVVRSTNGIDWIAGSTGSTTNLFSVASDGNQFVAVGDSGKIFKSSDGAVWTNMKLSTNRSLNCVTWNGSCFFITCSSGLIYTSLDGDAWSSINSGTSYPLYGIAWSGGILCAVGLYYSGVKNIYSSSDAINWAPANYDPGVTLYGISWCDGQFFTVGRSETILSSTDGINWISRRYISSSSGYLRSMAFNGQLFVVVGLSGLLFTSQRDATGLNVMGEIPRNNDIQLFNLGSTIQVKLPSSIGVNNVDLSICYISGKKIMDVNNMEASENISININRLSAGVYFLVIKIKNKLLTKKFLILK